MRWALSIGENTHLFLKIVFAKAPHRDMSYRWANSLKSLNKQYGEKRLDQACKRAIEIGADETAVVRSILKNNLDQQSLDGQESSLEASFAHDNIRGPDYYH